MSHLPPDPILSAADLHTRKIKRIVEAADGYVQRVNWHGDTRFDIITVIFFGDNFELEHFKDAFYPTL